MYIFKNRVVVGAGITQTINGFLTVVQVFYLPTFYQLAYGYSPVKSGLLVLPLTIVQSLGVYVSAASFLTNIDHVVPLAVASTGSGLIVTATGRYRVKHDQSNSFELIVTPFQELILAGWAIWAVGLGLMATLNERSTVGQQVGYALLTGIGVGQTFQPYGCV